MNASRRCLDWLQRGTAAQAIVPGPPSDGLCHKFGTTLGVPVAEGRCAC